MTPEVLLLQGIANMFNSPHADNYESGCHYLKQVLEENAYAAMDIYQIVEYARTDFKLNSALDQFGKVNEEDKLFLRVAANFSLAACCCLKLDFDKAREYISNVENVEYGFFTRKKDTIESFRKNCPNLRNYVDEFEKKIIEMAQEAISKASSNDGSVVETEVVVKPPRSVWKIATIVLSVLIILAIIGVVVLKFTNLL